jgi:hypothetical protein
VNIGYKNKLNRLLQDYYPGKLHFSDNLRQIGYSDQLLKQYRNSGWLTALSKGVMYRAGDTLRAFPAVACYNAQMSKSFYVAAHSALELHGFNHFVPMGKPVLMLGHPKQQAAPLWLRVTEFDRVIKFFSTEIFAKQYLTTMKVEGVDLLASLPEQAFFECLLLAPQQYAFMDLFYIMEQLSTLNPEIVQDLLENTDNLKVKRMFLFMAEKAGHYWYNLLDVSKINLGTSKLQLAKEGVYISKYKITVPKGLYDYE